MKKFIVIFILSAICSYCQSPKSTGLRISSPDTLSVKNSVSQYGITWTFDKKMKIGRFVNGDFYVIGPVTITHIDPPPEKGRNGSVIDLKLKGYMYTTGNAGWDSRIPYGRYDSTLRVYPPLTLQPGQSIISTISVDTLGKIENMFKPGQYNGKITTATAAVLTCLSGPVAADAFRPGYADPKKTMYYRKDLNDSLLPRLQRVDKTTSIAEFEAYLEKPWVESGYDEFTYAIKNMPVYGREYTRLISHAVLLLCLDFTQKEKEKLLIRVVQLGIDLWGLLESGYEGWPAVGGHGNGRKLPILFTGIMLKNNDMQHPYLKHPSVKFSEDIQTMYGSCWTGASVVFAGHAGKDGDPKKTDWGAYEHLTPDKWPGTTGEAYRRCCTSITWVGEALAAKLLHMEDIWDHPAFFDYVQRWMTENDSAFVRIIKEKTGEDYSASFLRQGQAWDKFIELMYAKYW